MELITQIKGVDILYLDPPYNERQYAPKYHILETIAKWDNPKIQGITGMKRLYKPKIGFLQCKVRNKCIKKNIRRRRF